MRGWGDGSPGLRTFIATHTRPSGSTARAATEPSRVSSVTDHSSAPLRPERLRRPGRVILLTSIWPASSTSPSAVRATRFVRLPAGPALNQAIVPGLGVETS